MWGQSSFLPQFFGRWKSTSSGTLITLQIVPNLALLVCLLCVFGVMGILVYDRLWMRVILTSGVNILMAYLLLQLGFLVAVGQAYGKLLKIINATSVSHSESERHHWTLRQLGIELLGGVIVIIGAAIWWGIHTGAISVSLRPAADLIIVAWSTLIFAVIWLYTLSGWSPITRVRCLFFCLAAQVGWTWLITIDGFAGDGRPLFTWRWLARDNTTGTVADGRTSNSIGIAERIDLRPAGSNDLPAFRGPHRDGVFNAIRLEANWETHKPQVIWQQPIGVGWSSFVVAGGYAVTQEQRGEDEAVVCYEVATGRECWEHREKARFQEMMGGDGPRATPTLDDGDVYALGATGIFQRLRGHDGHPVWSVNVIDDAKAPTSLFGLTGSPLIWNDLVIVNPGGREASLVAYEKQTGKRRWVAGSSLTAYASPQLVTLGGVEQILTFNADGIFAHAPVSGEILWSYPWVTPPEYNNVCQPVVWRDDAGLETVFLSSGYGKGCVLLDVSLSDGRFVATPRWQNTHLKVKFSSVVARDGFVFGLDENILVCLDLRSGNRRWKSGRYGYGQLILTENHILVLTENGDVVLCEATSERHHEVARLSVLNGRTWNHPALSGHTLLIRNDRTAACLKLPLTAESIRNRETANTTP